MFDGDWLNYLNSVGKGRTKDDSGDTKPDENSKARWQNASQEKELPALSYNSSCRETSKGDSSADKCSHQYATSSAQREQKCESPIYLAWFYNKLCIVKHCELLRIKQKSNQHNRRIPFTHPSKHLLWIYGHRKGYHFGSPQGHNIAERWMKLIETSY